MKITLITRIFFLYKQDKKGKMFHNKKGVSVICEILQLRFEQQRCVGRVASPCCRGCKGSCAHYI